LNAASPEASFHRIRRQRRLKAFAKQLPYALDFSPDGARAYVTSSGNNTLVAIDCRSRTILGSAKTGREPADLAYSHPVVELRPLGNVADAVSEMDGRGPAIVAEYSATTLIPPEWSACVDTHGQLLLTPK